MVMLRRRAMMQTASGSKPEPGTDWESGVAYSYDLVANQYYNTSGGISNYNGWSRTPYLPCKGATKVTVVGSSLTSTSGYYSGFFDEDYALVGSMKRLAAGNYTVPDGACYVGFSQSNSNMGKITSITPYA